MGDWVDSLCQRRCLFRLTQGWLVDEVPEVNTKLTAVRHRNPINYQCTASMEQSCEKWSPRSHHLDRPYRVFLLRVSQARRHRLYERALTVANSATRDFLSIP